MPLDVDATAIAGRWVKHSYPGAMPLARRDPPPDNRWQRGDEVDALYPSFQLVGETLAAEGWRGLVAPSAARPAHLVLCLFRAADVAATSNPLRLQGT